MPWCRPEKLERRPLKLGETLAGDFLVKSLFKLTFLEPLSDAQLCEKPLSAEHVQIFLKAIQKRFVYELLLDDLPMKLFVGEISDEKPNRYYLYTHIEFSVSVNNDRIIEATATPGLPVELKDGQASKVRFSYSVKWETVSYIPPRPQIRKIFLPVSLVTAYFYGALTHLRLHI